MAKQEDGFIDGLLQKRMARKWARAAREAQTMSIPALRTKRSKARVLRQHLDTLLFHAENRLALPRIGSNSFFIPHGTVWSWRPALWRGPLPSPGIAAVKSKTQFGEEVTLYHDCRVSEITMRQLRNTREADLAPYGLRLDVFRFDGSFLSLVIEMPEDGIKGLKRNHVIRMDTIVEMEKPLEIFARLNIKHGPNTEQIVRELPLHEEEIKVEFDLAYTKINEKRIEKIWVDLIFEGPEMNQVILRDVTFSRRPRAEL